MSCEISRIRAVHARANALDALLFGIQALVGMACSIWLIVLVTR